MSQMREILLKYIRNSPYCTLHKDWDNMTVGQLLSELDAGIDSDEVHKDKTYKFVRIDSYQEALQYKEYVPDWCIVESREAFEEHIEEGRNHFVFCIREDIDDYPRKTFGDSYPYDNYGLSMIAVCVNGWGELVSVTSRWNYVEAEHYDNFLTREELSELFSFQTKVMTLRRHSAPTV